jgi:hypothetical protein
MSKCQTIAFLPEFSGCLVANPTCGYAVRFGFSYHCEHPNHLDFYPVNDPEVNLADLPNLYRELKEARRLQEQAGGEVALKTLPSARRPSERKRIADSKKAQSIAAHR